MDCATAGTLFDKSDLLRGKICLNAKMLNDVTVDITKNNKKELTVELVYYKLLLAHFLAMKKILPRVFLLNIKR